MKKKAVIYARVSTLLNQDPAHQVNPLGSLAKGREFDLVGEYVDYISGTKSKRRELDRLVGDAQKGKFRAVLIHTLDRMARDVRFLLSLLYELEGCLH